MFKGALIFLFGGIVGSIIGVLAGGLLGFFGGAIAGIIWSGEEDETAETDEAVYRGASTPPRTTPRPGPEPVDSTLQQ